MVPKDGSTFPGWSTASAFTIRELLAIVAVLSLLIVVIFPGVTPARKRAQTEACKKNLKQIGLGFRTWALSGDQYPGRTQIAGGGVLELVETGQAFIHFRSLSNDLASPRILVCPADPIKQAATNFHVRFGESNVSYFVGADASDIAPQMILTGDRNLAHDQQPIGPGLFVLATNDPRLSWTRNLHGSCGNIGFADGSVKLLSSKELTTSAREQGEPTNRLCIP